MWWQMQQKGRKLKRWTQEENFLLIFYYVMEELDVTLIAIYLNRSKRAIYAKVAYMKLRRPNPKNRSTWSLEDDVELCRLKHETNMSDREIASVMKRKKSQVSFRLTSKGYIYNPIHKDGDLIGKIG
jgi:hypothetical protein